jgi:hypothetical protein
VVAGMIAVHDIGFRNLGLLLAKNGYLSRAFEASPIYTGIRVTVSLSGTRTDGLDTMTFAIADEEFEFTRVPLGLPAHPAGIQDNLDTFGAFDTTGIADDECTMAALAGLLDSVPLSLMDPKHGTFIAYSPGGNRDLANIGQFQHDSDPPVDLSGWISITIPQFALSATPAAGTRGPLDRLTLALTVGPDESFYDIIGGFTLEVFLPVTPARDLRGTYSDTIGPEPGTSTVTADVAVEIF